MCASGGRAEGTQLSAVDRYRSADERAFRVTFESWVKGPELNVMALSSFYRRKLSLAPHERADVVLLAPVVASRRVVTARPQSRFAE